MHTSKPGMYATAVHYCLSVCLSVTFDSRYASKRLNKSSNICTAQQYAGFLNQPWKIKWRHLANDNSHNEWRIFVMVLFGMWEISKDDRALINVLRREKNWSSQRLLRKFFGKNWTWTSVDRLLKKINSTSVKERLKGNGCPRSVRMLEFRKTSNSWRSLSAVMKVLCISTKIRTKLKGTWTFHCRPFGALQSMTFGWNLQALVSVTVIG